MFQPLTGLVVRENERELARRFAIAGRARLAREAACGEANGGAGAGRGASHEPAPALASTSGQIGDRGDGARGRTGSTARASAA
jgi:hypothetical protein